MPSWLALQPSRLVGLALVAAGVLPPVGLVALPGGLSMLGPARTGIVLVAALLLAPALVGFAVAMRGFDATVARLRDAVGDECRQVVARVLLGALILLYLFILSAARPGDRGVAAALPVGALNLAAAWLFLLNVLLAGRPSALRSYAATACDVALLSVLLAVGGEAAATLAIVYLYIAIGAAAHQGLRAMAITLALEIAAFGAVVVVTPFWRERPPLAGGMAAAMALLPAYVGAVLHRLAAARTAAETANAAKNRFLAALNDDLRGPLRTIARAGAAIDRATLDPAQWDMIARMRLSARAMLLQLDDMLNYVRIDEGSFAPEMRPFDLYRLASGAVAALRATAAERGIVLALRIDPQLPYRLRGWPHELRQVLVCLITNAMRRSGQTRLRINLDAVEIDADRVTLRLAVSGNPGADRLETADEEVDGGGRHLGLAVADRLVRLMGGRLAVDTDPQRGLTLAAELPFAVDQASLALPLDLAHLPVLIVTKDAEFVADLVGPLEAWRADPRWIGAGDTALGYLQSFDPGPRRAVLVVDGRGDVLQALSWAHRATAPRGPDSPFVLFVADEPRIDSVVGLADGELDGILPAPFTQAALRSALHALRVEPADWFLAEPLPVTVEDAPAPPRRRRPPAVDEPPPRPAPAAEAPPRLRVAAEPAPPVAAVPPPAEPVAEPPPEPLRHIPPRPAPSHPAAPPARRRCQVLVAAGNAANRKILGSILARAGHSVQFAEDVDEARQGLETRAVDALLLDLTGYAGADYGAARQCRRARPNLAIIALSADPPEIAERRGRDAGLDAVLPKPVEPRRLVAAIATALAAEPAAATVDPSPVPRGVVTELASHPRFVGDTAPAAGESGEVPWPGRDGEALQGLIDTFRIDSARIVADIDRACGAGDIAAFETALRAMRACTEVFGTDRMRDLLGSMRDPTPAKLRLQGADFVHRLESEIARLDAALIDYLKTAK